MEVREIKCDREKCEKRNASGFAVFSHRSTDGVDTVDWDHLFDLCADCTVIVLRGVLNSLDPTVAKRVLETYNIKARLG